MPDQRAAAPAPALFADGRKRILLVASTGGHLSQLVRLAQRENVAADSVWVTFDSPQSRSLLAGKPTLWVDYVAPRDAGATLRAYRRIAAALDPADFDGVLSTGAAVGAAGLAWAKRHGIPGHYVESVSRTDGPSLTGRIVRGLRLGRTYTQHPEWASRQWQPVESVLGEFRRETTEPRPDSADPLKILVTLGTIRPYRFDRLVDRVVDVSLPGDEIIWQLGETHREDLPGTAHRMLEADELLEAALAADVVVTHSGVGTVLQMLDHGVSPIVVPRHKEWQEHVDDHQLQIWRLLSRSGIGHPVEVPELTREVLTRAAASRTVGHGAA
ncbi:glycosyltransferase [Leucobacter triazinivorans]|uniref:Glycosyltransferase n=1 Tax=Leucobacter triazinivorans TaxID=1784719 RepID=A0A4P6KET8_9MICO|nr:glycosyltransferase [Leucobacter triazinivorans]QBE48640.1 glycosyltransferase [Leucobacter triazinivorans]